MYRNSEYYPDPTAGAALAHIAYEEWLARKKIRQVNGRKHPKRRMPALISSFPSIAGSRGGD